MESDVGAIQSSITSSLSWCNTTFPPIPFSYPGAEIIKEIKRWYVEYHCYTASVVCVFGIVANILNIIVLTRKNMISTTNYILTGLAVSDGLTMAAYLPFALHYYCLHGTKPSPVLHSYGAAWLNLVYACFSIPVHTVSIWLTVTLAIFRYIFIRLPDRAPSLCTLSKARLAVFLVNVATLVVCLPNFFTLEIFPTPFDEGGDYDVNSCAAEARRLAEGVANSTTRPMGTGEGGETMWFIRLKTSTDTDKFVHNLNFWLQAVLVRLVPCLGLTVLSMLLVKAMKEADKRRKALLERGVGGPDKKGEGRRMLNQNGSDTGSVGTTNKKKPSDRKTNKTTVMLLTVVLLFLITEFPQGILNLLSGLLLNFEQEVYSPLGDIMDILALLNNGINFILYCTMSKQFRDTFFAVFKLDKLCRSQTTV